MSFARSSQRRRWGSRRRSDSSNFPPCILLAAVVILVLFLRGGILLSVSLLPSDESGTASTKAKILDVQTFRLKSGVAQLSHLDPINPLLYLEETGFTTLDQAHRNGLMHMGAWIGIVDTSMTSSPTSISSGNLKDRGHEPRILLLKRGEKLVTCPSSWGLVGEHTYRDEPPIETVRRAIREELGDQAFNHVERYGSIQNITAVPVYYERDYGMGEGMDGRVDKQITYLWLVEMNVQKIFDAGSMGGAKEKDGASTIKAAEGLMTLDDEVASHTWVTVDEFDEWIKLDPTGDDFCHETIITLSSLVVKQLKLLRRPGL